MFDFPLIEAEIIATLLSDNRQIAKAIEAFGSDGGSCFEDPLNAQCYEWIADMISREGRATRLGLLSRVQGNALEKEFKNRIDYYAEVSVALEISPLIERLIERRNSKAFKSIVSKAFLQPYSEELVGSCVRDLTSLLRSSSSSPRLLSEVATRLRQDIERNQLIVASGGSVERGLWSGLRLSSGAPIYIPNENDLTVIAARPGKGKTDLAKQIATNFILQGKSGIYFSIEMSAMQMTRRIISAMSGTRRAAAASGKASEEELEKIYAAIDKTSKAAKLLIVDSSSIRLPVLQARVREAFALHKIQWVIVDYLQLVRGAHKERRHEIDEIMAGCKQLAGEMNLAFIVLSQFSREAARAKPSLHHLRESGGIEQDASVVWLIDSSIDENSGFGTMTVEVAKHRHSSLGTFSLRYDANSGLITSFYNQEI